MSKGEDTLSGGDYDYFYDYNKPDESKRRSLIFTDRSIYRPGQTILVKGVLYEELTHSEFQALKRANCNPGTA
ncbi:MAG: hypothetical protein KL787_07140 [Taibaiella sp.]|nr:hypothetical protein [Taibaiella sp.]